MSVNVSAAPKWQGRGSVRISWPWGQTTHLKNHLKGFFFPITHLKDLLKILSGGVFTLPVLFPSFIHFYEAHLQETTTIHTHIYTWGQFRVTVSLCQPASLERSHRDAGEHGNCSHVASKYLDIRAFTVGLRVQARAVLDGHGATGLWLQNCPPCCCCWR